MTNETFKDIEKLESDVFILDKLWVALPRPPFSEEETEEVANRIYDYVWQRSAANSFASAFAG